jgi:dephospho-CoA kinase
MPGAREALMKVIGLLGGIASGKSLVARELERLGATIIDADRAGHDVLRYPNVKQAARQRWGNAIFGAAGEIDRKALAAIVFARTDAGRRELEHLERLSHPEIGRLLNQQMEQLREQGVRAAILDAPVMLKAGWDRFCDEIWFVDAPYETRLARAKSRGWTAEDFHAREIAQEPVDRKRELADFVLDNSGDIAYTRGQIERLWQRLGG